MKFRILIVEDEKPQADRMKYLMRKKIEEDLDITVSYGVDDETTMKRYDIAVVDLNMPYFNSNLPELDENAGKFVIDRLVNCNPDIFIIIRTAVSSIETVANASNAAGRGNLKYISKTIQKEDILIDEIKAQIQCIKERYPNRIDYGKLTYIHKESETYELYNWKSYRYDNVYVNGQQIDLPNGGQKAALYKYLVSKEQWLPDRAVLEFAGYDIQGLYPEEVAKRYKDNIMKYFKFLKDAGLAFESKYGMGQHKIIMIPEMGIME